MIQKPVIACMRRNVGTIIFVAALGVPLLSGCSSSGSSKAGSKVKRLAKSNVERVKEGMSETQVFDILGQPEITTDLSGGPGHPEDQKARLLVFNDKHLNASVLLLKGEVVGLNWMHTVLIKPSKELIRESEAAYWKAKDESIGKYEEQRAKSSKDPKSSSEDSDSVDRSGFERRDPAEDSDPTNQTLRTKQSASKVKTDSAPKAESSNSTEESSSPPEESSTPPEEPSTQAEESSPGDSKLNGSAQ